MQQISLKCSKKDAADYKGLTTIYQTVANHWPVEKQSDEPLSKCVYNPQTQVFLCKMS